jgi:aryl-alcohol dehydrogenase-like predicted oxidoreductase
METKELGTGGLSVSAQGLGCMGKSAFYGSRDDADYRRSTPRFQGENFKRNLELVDRFNELAVAKGCAPAQLALAWVIAQGADIVPIPGTRNIDRLEENVGALEISLTPDELQTIAETLPPAAGQRYPETMMSLLNG